MSWKFLRNWIERRNSKDRRERELDEELNTHLALEAEEQEEDGATPAEARRRARLALGNPTLIKEDVRQAWGWSWLENWIRDLRYSVKSLARSPGFTALVILSLAVGIGATTSVFTVYHAAFLRSLPVQDPQELRILNWTSEARQSITVSGYFFTEDGASRCSSFSWEAYQAIRDNAPAFSSVAGFSNVGTIVRGPSSAESAQAQLVSADFFDTVGVRPAIGRTFTVQEDSLGSQPVVVLSWRTWQRLFGGDPKAIGSDLAVERVPYTVIGVLPPRFTGLSAASAPSDIYLPLARAGELSPAYSFDDPNNWWIQTVGRLAPGSDDRQARAQIDVILQRRIDAKALLMDGRTGLASLNKTASTTLLTLFAMVGLALLVTCANVANLTLARAAARTRELAVRLSLGAGRMRILRLSLAESFALAVAGGLIGLGLARLGAVALTDVLWPGGNVAADLRPDAVVFGFTTALCFLTAVVFGVVPAFRSTRVAPASCLKQGGTGAALLRQRLAKSLLVVQVAIAFVLVFGAGLFDRTLANLGRVELGFRADHLLLFNVAPGRNGYQDEALVDITRRLQERVAAIPGVSEATFSRMALIAGGMSSRTIEVPGYVREPDERVANLNNVVSDNFFQAIEMPILLGRSFEPSDDAASVKVAVVNQALAARYFSGNPVGHDFTFWGSPDDPIRVVGVAADAKYNDIRADVQPTVYLPNSQNASGSMTFALRASVDPMSLANAVRSAVAEVDPTLPVSQIRTQRQQIDRILATERMFAFLASFLSAITLALACIGVYGTLSYAVTRRRGEFGLRMALGATSGSLCWRVLRGAVVVLAIGVAIGVPSALAMVRLVSSRLFGLEGTDPVTMATALLAMLLAAGLGAWIPARRAAALNPAVALRNE